MNNLFDPREKIALFIDGINLYATAKALNFDIDYKLLLQEFSREAFLLRASYYTTLSEDQEYSSIRPLIDWLDYNGFQVVTRAKKEYFEPGGRRKMKDSIDILLAVDVFEMLDNIDHIVLFSGDSDFQPLVELVQRRGRKVTAVSTTSSQTPMIADDLRRQVDHFIDLVDIADRVCRKGSGNKSPHDSENFEEYETDIGDEF